MSIEIQLSDTVIVSSRGPSFHCNRCNWEGEVPACPHCDADVYKAATSAALAEERAAKAPLLEAVRDMRRLQRAWFGGDKSRETLNSAKAAERRVDKLLAEIDAPSAVQPDLFGGR